MNAWNARMAGSLRSLAVGAVLFLCMLVNIGVAWGFAVWGDVPRDGYASVATEPWPRKVPDNWPPVSDTCRAVRWGVSATEWFGLRPWKVETFEGHQIAFADQTEAVWRYRVGWPFRSMHWWAVPGGHMNSAPLPIGTRLELGGGLDLPSGLTTAPIEGRALPIWPYWPGFLANTLIYAAMVGALAFCPSIVNRLRRHRTGCCRRCGYAVRDLPLCPECGTERSVRSAESGALASQEVLA